MTIKTKSSSKPAKQSVYLTLRELLDPVTGRNIAAFVASDQADRSILLERGYRIGDKVRAQMNKPRNEQFHRLVHALGSILVSNIDGYSGMRSHDAIKKMQLEARVYCEQEQFEVEGMALVRYIPRSMSFDSMDESAFQDFWKQICEYIANKYWSNMSYDEFYEMTEKYYGII